MPIEPQSTRRAQRKTKKDGFKMLFYFLCVLRELRGSTYLFDGAKNKIKTINSDLNRHFRKFPHHFARFKMNLANFHPTKNSPQI
jgi:hypothetical protein